MSLDALSIWCLKYVEYIRHELLGEKAMKRDPEAICSHLELL